MELKIIQEAWDKCNFSEEEKKLFPRPETEEDLKNIEKIIQNSVSNGLGSFYISMMILFMLFGFGFNNSYYTSNIDHLKNSLNKVSEEKID